MGMRIVGMAAWLADLESLPERAREQMPKVVSKGALNIKTDWRARWTGAGHLPHIPASIGYDTDEQGDTFHAQIGAAPLPDINQGKLANFLEYGSINNAPHPAGMPALLAEEPRFVQAAGDLAVDLLDGP